MHVDNSPISLIVSYTDFGVMGPYQGQMAAVLATKAPRIPQVTLMADAPMFDPQAAGILLACLCEDLPPDTLILAVVDPGVGGSRRPVMLKTESRLFVGPDNGLFVPVIHSAANCEIETIDWRPQRLSESFHGRDLFAPVAARLATGEAVEGSPLQPRQLVGFDSPLDGKRIIYIDHYGNAMSGIKAGDVADDQCFMLGAASLAFARTFSEAPEGRAFWYRNSIGLVEFAVNLGSAARLLKLEPGMRVEI